MKCVRGGGLEPPMTGPEPVVLPITPSPIGVSIETARVAQFKLFMRSGERHSSYSVASHCALTASNCVLTELLQPCQRGS